MFDLIFQVLSFASAFLIVCALIARMHLLPKRDFSKFQIKILINYTERLRTGSKFAKVAFWGLPVAIFLFAHAWAGLLFLGAQFAAAWFNSAYVQDRYENPQVAG